MTMIDSKSEARKSPCVQIETVTPEMAEAWLNVNYRNRDLRESRVTQLAGTLLRGQFELTSDGIAFDTTGILTNGQHRLSAIVVSGISAQLVVVRGLQAKAQEVTDQNLPRCLADALKLRGEKNYHVLAAGLVWLYRFSYIEETGNVHFGDLGLRPTTPQLLKIFEANQEIRELPRLVAKVRHSVPVRNGVFLAFWHRINKLDAAEAALFIEKFMVGAELTKTDPIFVLRRILQLDSQRSFERMPDYREAALLIKAWNAWRESKPITKLAYKYGPKIKEPFPIPK